MNEEPQVELDIVELGDAKEVTMGVISTINTEMHPTLFLRTE